MDVLISKRLAIMTGLAFFGRLQNTMTAIALLAAGTAVGLSPIQSSFLGAAFFLAAAISALIKGRSIDTQGHSVVVRLAVLSALAFVLIIVSLLFLPWWMAAVGSFALGAVRLNPGIMQQSIWSHYHEGHLLQRALAMETLLGTAAQIGGPLLVALLLWLSGGIGSLLFTGIVACTSMLLWGILASKQQRKPTDISGKSGLSPLPILFPLAISLFMLSLLVGLLQGLLLQGPLPYPALLIALFALGASIASLYYFCHGFSLQKKWQLILIIAPIPFIPLFPFLSLPLLVIFLPLAGTVFASASLGVNSEIKSLVSSTRLNESFSLILLANTLGISFGIFSSGILLEKVPDHWHLFAAIIPVLFILINVFLLSFWKRKQLEGSGSFVK